MHETDAMIRLTSVSDTEIRSEIQDSHRRREHKTRLAGRSHRHASPIASDYRSQVTVKDRRLSQWFSFSSYSHPFCARTFRSCLFRAGKIIPVHSPLIMQTKIQLKFENNNWNYWNERWILWRGKQALKWLNNRLHYSTLSRHSAP